LSMRLMLILAFATVAFITPSLAHDAAHHHVKEQRLPKIAPAPPFALTSQDGTPVSLVDLRGKIVAVTFIYTSCTDTCPVLTALMAHVQDKLGRDFGERIAFVSITVDPERDTTEVLKQPISKVGRSLPAPRRPFGTSSAVTACSPRRTPTARWTIRSSRRSLTGTACCACNIWESGLIPTNFGVTS
jgi:hypothetical protein